MVIKLRCEKFFISSLGNAQKFLRKYEINFLLFSLNGTWYFILVIGVENTETFYSCKAKGKFFIVL